jgi:predicted ATPase/class 3 adenylate cyclase
MSRDTADRTCKCAAERITAPNVRTADIGAEADTPPVVELPTGIVTFLFTDVEGSTQMLERVPAAYGESLKRHDAILRSAVAAHRGVVFETIGDAIYAAFDRATEAIAAALQAQLELRHEAWGEIGELRVRMGLHTGEAERRGDHYFGRALYRCARLTAIGYGGQILVSSTTASLIVHGLPSGAGLRSLGSHRLKDLAEPEEPYQLEHVELIAEFPPLKSLDARPNNLPVEISTFVGRERELAEVRRLLDAKRLVTITGAGGTGKTRLSLQVAAEASDGFADGVFFVPLAAVAEAPLVLAEIAQAFGVREAAGQSLAERVKEHLAAKDLLLVLDNFEHVINAAEIVADLLSGAAGLKVLVTSRAPLRVAGEQEYPVPPLDVPDFQGPVPLERLVTYAAVRLFSERAIEVRPDFAITTENANSVVEICRRLDGLPLAIELAATRIKLFDPESMLRRLGHGLGLLVDGRRDAPARQRTLRSAIAWSHDLLAPQERDLFRRLAVFAGGFTLEAAEAICGSGDASDVLGSLAALVENSLVRQDRTITERFAMLGTIREYALEQLASDHDASAVRRRHAEHFLAMMERARNAGSGERQATQDRLERDHENIHAAVEWAAENDLGDLGLRMAVAATPFWWRGGHWAEGVTLLRSVLALPTATAATAERGAALDALARLGIARGNMAEAQSALQESVRIWRALGDGPHIVQASLQLSNAFTYCGDFGGSAAVLEEALALARSVHTASVGALLHNLGGARAFGGDLEGGRLLLEEALRERPEPVTLLLLGEVERMAGDYERSTELLEKSLAELRSRRSEFYVAPGLAMLALTVALRGDFHRATALCTEGLEMAHRLGHQPALALGLDVLAILHAETGQVASAARLFGAADALRTRTGMAVWEPARLHADKARHQARVSVGDAAFAQSCEEGTRMSLERVLADALGPPDPAGRS